MAKEKTSEYYLTKEGVAELRKELDYLITIKRPEVITALKEARSLGDLSENADYDAARNEQAQVEARITQLEHLLSNVVIIKNGSKEKVAVGSTVEIEYIEDEGDSEIYKIVGSQEADPSNNKISNKSPIANAILNHKVGDIVKVESPNGEYEVKIKNIE
ncbi:MAG: transcription elongation factor GreA [Bacilli bacterium]